MIEHRGNIWDHPAQVKCITTNGMVNAQGLAVMGRGVALQATKRYPNIARNLGVLLLKHGNRVLRLGVYADLPNTAEDVTLVSFPVKYHWKDKANPELIVRSAHQLVALTGAYDWDCVVLPRPGCGNGGLNWERVRPLLDVLDDRFVVVTL